VDVAVDTVWRATLADPRLSRFAVRVAEHVEVALVVERKHRRIVGIDGPLVEPDLGSRYEARLVIEIRQGVVDVSPRPQVDVETEREIGAVVLGRVDGHRGNLLRVRSEPPAVLIGVVAPSGGDLVPNALKTSGWS